jgi:DNA polymerase elongation subunit (family B)
MFIITIRKLANTNENTNEIFSSVYCDNLYRYNFSSMYPSVNIDRKISCGKIRNEKKGKQYDDM